jgi:hypothetical protein
MPRKANNDAKAGAVGAGKATAADRAEAGRQSTLPEDKGGATVGEGAESARDQNAGGGAQVFPEKPAEELREVSIAEVHIEITQRGHPGLAATLGRLEEFRREIEEPGFSEAVGKWRMAVGNDLVRRCGPSVAGGWMRGPARGVEILFDEFAGQWHGRGQTNLDELRYWVAQKDGGKWQIANPVAEDDWISGFIALLRNPLVSRELCLQLNALTLYYAARRGNVRFFERVSEVFRKRERRNMQAAGGSAKDMILFFWIPAGLWRLSVSEGCEKLNEIIRSIKGSGYDTPAAKTVKTAVATLQKRTYEKAKERLKL